MEPEWRRRADGVPEDRRAPQRKLFTPGQLLGTEPIRLRRASDKRRLVGHLLAVALLVALTGWWVVPAHSFAGPVLVRLSATQGVHRGDLPVLVFLAVAARSLVAARTLLVSR